MKALPAPQTAEEVDLYTSGHSLLPPTLQMVNALMSPVTVHSKVKGSPGQVGGAAVNCPVTTPAWKDIEQLILIYPAHKSHIAISFACQVLVAGENFVMQTARVILF